MSNILQKNRYWVAAFIWVILIYSTLGVVRPVCEFLKENTPFSLLINSIMAAAGIAALIMVLRCCRMTRARSVYLFVFACVYAFSLWMIETSEEKTHLIQYGVLSFLLYQALALHAGVKHPYFGAFVLACVFGWIDELIQHIMPGRYYQNKDVLLNAFGAFLGICLVFICRKD